jgi:hypothetical protein
MQRDILGRNAERDQGIRTRNLATATPLKRTSVTDGHTEFNGNESLLVKGSQLVSGWLIITGTLKGVGTLIWEQAVNFSGVFTMSGKTTLKGPTELQADLTVKNSGKLTIEGPIPVVLGKVGNFVGMFFGTGARVIGWLGGLALLSPNSNNSVTVTDAGVGITADGTKGFLVDSKGTTLSGDVYFKDLPTIMNVASNVGIDDDGKFGIV